MTFEPDANLYKNDLNHYLGLSHDYWGAPWTKAVDGKIEWIGVGNSGFSLRRTSVFLRYFRIQERLNVFLRAKKSRELIFITFIKAFLKLASPTSYSPVPNPELAEILEDGFWSSTAYGDHCQKCCSLKWRLALLFPFLVWKIRFPRPSQATKFSVETNARWALATSKVTIPTGSHALVKYDEILHQELLKLIQ